MTRWIAPAIALLVLAWVALLVAAPLLPTLAAALLYAGGSLICHQIAERSFHLGEFQLPVCARCLGLYAGAAAGCVAGLIGGRALAARHALATRRRPAYALTIVAALPTILTWTLEWGADVPFSNVSRFVAALPLGAVIAFVVMGALATLHYGECLPRRPIGHGQPPATSI